MKLLFLLTTSLILLLSGCAPTMSVLHQGPIEQDATTRSWGAMVNDSTIETVTAVNIKKSHPDMTQADIDVVSYNGFVLLVGHVPSKHLKQLAESEAKKTRDVRKVFNELIVGNVPSFFLSSNDTWLTTKVKANMVAEKDFPSSRIKIITEDGTVYMMGLVTREEADKAVNITRNTDGVQKIVKVFEYIP